MTEKEKLISAKSLIDSDCFEEALEILLQLNLEERSEKFIEMRSLFLSQCYFQTENYSEGLFWAEKVMEINKANEFGSQLKYLCLVKLNEIDKALREVLKFLKSNPANLYKVTLKELMIDIYAGNIQDVEVVDEIKMFAIENKVFK